MRKKIYSYLGFATKSRNLINGFNTCTMSMNKGRVKLLIIAEDLSENSMKKILKEAEKQKVTCRLYGTVETLSEVTGNSDVGIYGITDNHFAEVILKEIDNEKSIEKEVF